MRCSSLLVVAAGFALGSTIIPVSASAGVLGAASPANLQASPMVRVSWKSQLPIDQETWRAMSQDERHLLRSQWQASRSAATQDDPAPMNRALTQSRGGLQSSSFLDPSFSQDHGFHGPQFIRDALARLTAFIIQQLRILASPS
jgi:hypothetical protein